MPTTEDFDEAAAALDAAARATVGLVEPARALAQKVMAGGRLTDVVTDELDAVTIILEQVTTELDQLSKTCRERAEVARDALLSAQEYEAAYTTYQSELRRWQETATALASAGREPGTPPEPPVAPPAPPQFVSR